MDITKINIKPFDGTNFNLWRWQVFTYIKAAKLDKVLSGDNPTPEDELKFDLILSQTMTREQLIHVVSLPTGKEKWQRLMDIHFASSADTIQNLYSEFFTLTPDDMDMATYMAKLNNIKVVLEEMDHKLEEELIIGNILAKLPERYTTFVVSWNSTTKA